MLVLFVLSIAKIENVCFPVNFAFGSSCPVRRTYGLRHSSALRASRLHSVTVTALISQ